MIPKEAFVQLEELLSAGDTGRKLAPRACDWSADLAAACTERLVTASIEQRQRIIRLLDRIAAPDAKAVLLGYLPQAQEEDAAEVWHSLCRAGSKVGSDHILRWIDKVGIPAICAAGLSGDLGLVPKLESLLAEDQLGWHAALALARLRHRPSVEKIARRIAESQGLDRVGFIVALEVMNDPAAVPLLRDLLLSRDDRPAWDLGHALWRLTGREPLVPIDVTGKGLDQAIASAWRQVDLDAVPRPRMQNLTFEPDERTATFEILDGEARLRVDCDPPAPGASWPRWEVSLYLEEQRLYTVGTLCDTCETTLHWLRMPSERATLAAASIREALVTLSAPRQETLQALAPLLTAMRTGHYLARVVDLDLQYVTVPERSWLTQRLLIRQDPAGSFCDPAVINWPGTEHFQMLRPVLEDIPTYGLVLPTSPLAKLDRDTVERYEDELRRGARPAALLLAWLEEKHVQSELTERFLVSIILDGHHQLMAYRRQGIAARCLVISRLDECAGPLEDRSRWLRQSLHGFEHRSTT